MSCLRLGLGALALSGLLDAARAHAYTIESTVTTGCHEEVTGDILRNVRQAEPKLAVPLPASQDDLALMDDVRFTVASDLHDLAAVTLILGVRENDVKNFGAEALDQIAALNADPNAQRLHCLRRADEDEPTGSQEAVDDCRAFIKENLLAALDGLDENGLPDGTKRDPLDVALAVRGQITVNVPRFYLRAGHALHTIEDSFTHTFRSVDDPHKITVVLNWIDYADNRLDESRDGPAHATDLDRCDDADALRTERHKLAIEAGIAALSVVTDRTLDRAAKEKGIDAMLDHYILFDTKAHCTYANHWCDAPENVYRNSGCLCSSASSGRGGTPASSLATALVGFWAWRRRRRALVRALTRKPSRRTRTLAVLSLSAALGWMLTPRSARADTPEAAAASANPPAYEEPLRALRGESNAGAPNREDPAGSFFGRVAAGASYDKPGFAGGLGVRYQLNRPLMFGFDAELNPFVAQSPTRVRAGVLSAYFSIIRRFQLKNDSVNIRSQAALGASFLLIDLVGAPAGSAGPFFGLSFLGVEWKMKRGFYLTVDPTYLAFPVPHLTGAPFGYLQYRFLVGLEFGG